MIMMNNKYNKKKILFLILESDKKCSESLYFDLLKQNKDELKYTLITYKIGPNLSKEKIQIIKDFKNVKKIVLIKDNDVKNYTMKDIEENIICIWNSLIDCNENGLKIKKDDIERFGIPNEGINFDFFLLAHFDCEIFKKSKHSKRNVFKKLKELLGEKFKGDKNKIGKVFKENYKKNLFFNLNNFDIHYYKLICLIFTKDN